MMKHITFIGGIGKADEFGGELLKNKNIIARMKQVGYRVNAIDTYRSHHSLSRRLNVVTKILLALLFRRKDVFVLASSFENVYGLIKLMHYLPFDYDIVDWVIGCSLNKLVKEKLVDKKYMSSISLHVVEAEGMKRELMDSLAITNIVVSYNFRDLTPIPPISKYEDGRIHFLFFSRITPLKGVSIILSAASILNKEGYEHKYCIDFYGEVAPEYKDEFYNGINKNKNLSFCKTLQLKDRSNYDHLARYHYMLFPTFWPGEGFPGAIIDCYIAGVPIIASNWGYIPEFIEEGMTGRIIPTHNVEMLANVMKEAINGEMNCLEMSRNCQIKAKEFDTVTVLSESFLNKIGGKKTFS